MELRKLALLCLVLLLSLAPSGARADEATDVKELVEKAAAAFKDRGREYALKLINASAGPFRTKGELYVFAFDGEAVILAHPVNTKTVGRNQKGIKDAKGQLFAEEFLRVGKEQGAGWVEYWWLRHGENDPTLKRAYIMKVPNEDVFLAAGYYVK